jgi:hypothetical protein
MGRLGFESSVEVRRNINRFGFCCGVFHGGKKTRLSGWCKEKFLFFSFAGEKSAGIGHGARVVCDFSKKKFSRKALQIGELGKRQKMI